VGNEKECPRLAAQALRFAVPASPKRTPQTADIAAHNHCGRVPTAMYAESLEAAVGRVNVSKPASAQLSTVLREWLQNSA